VPSNLPYADPINRAAIALDFPPLFAYAIACRESIIGEMNGKWNAATVVSGDNGHGLFQLTSWWPDDWQDPYTNAYCAIKDWLLQDVPTWLRQYGMTGDALIKCVAASFNAGLGAALAAHSAGNVDACTSEDYGAGVVSIFHNLVAKGAP